MTLSPNLRQFARRYFDRITWPDPIKARLEFAFGVEAYPDTYPASVVDTAVQALTYAAHLAVLDPNDEDEDRVYRMAMIDLLDRLPFGGVA